MAGILHTYAQQTLHGVIYDALTHAPLSGADIRYARQPLITSDANGRFSIVCGLAQSITVSYSGYVSQEKQIKSCIEDLHIELEPQNHTLSTVEISATSNSGRAILYQPASIVKLDSQELKRSTGLFLDDAVNENVPGVLMERRSVSGGQQINIRGYGSGTRGTNGTNSNFDIQGVKIYLNGIPLTDAEGITILDDVDFGSIGNVEVVKGPSGTLYGLAIAGVVSLKTIRPDPGKTSLSQDVLVGSYGLRRYTTSLMVGTERSSLLLNFGYQQANGFMVHSASQKRFVNMAGDFQLNAKQSLSTYFGYSDSYDERGGELTTDQYNNHDFSGNPGYIKNNAHSGVVTFRAGLTHTYAFNNHVSNATTVYGSGVSNNSSSAAGWTDKDPVNFGLRSVVNVQFGLGRGLSLNGIAGVETQHQLAQAIGYAMVNDPANPSGYNVIGAMRSNQYTIDRNLSLFTEWTFALPCDLAFTAGIGESRMRIELNDRFFVANKPTFFAKTYDGLLAPHLSVNKVFSRAVSLYASYSTGFKAPVSSYFFIPYVANTAGTGQVNQNLKPEKAEQFETGFKGSLPHNKFTWQLAYFNTTYTDKMSSVAVTQGTTTCTRMWSMAESSYIAASRHRPGMRPTVHRRDLSALSLRLPTSPGSMPATATSSTSERTSATTKWRALLRQPLTQGWIFQRSPVFT
jgi:iron complex outermembrane receptor protein